MDNERALNRIFERQLFFSRTSLRRGATKRFDAERIVRRLINWLLGDCITAYTLVNDTLLHYFAVSLTVHVVSDIFLIPNFISPSTYTWTLFPVSHVKRYRYISVSRQYLSVSVYFGTITSRNLRNWNRIHVFEINTATKQTSLRFQSESL